MAQTKIPPLGKGEKDQKWRLVGEMLVSRRVLIVSKNWLEFLFETSDVLWFFNKTIPPELVWTNPPQPKQFFRQTCHRSEKKRSYDTLQIWKFTSVTNPEVKEKKVHHFVEEFLPSSETSKFSAFNCWEHLNWNAFPKVPISARPAYHAAKLSATCWTRNS